MKRTLLLLLAVAVIPFQSANAEDKSKSVKKRPLNTLDYAKWNSVRGAGLSRDGKWFGHQIAPNEGSAKAYIQTVDGKKKYDFKIGTAAGFSRRRGGGGSSGGVTFSHNSKWVAFMVRPTEKQRKKAAKTKKPTSNKAVLVNLESGEKTEFVNARSFAFSGECSTWFAVHKSAPKGRPSGSSGWSGSDLILHELSSAKQNNMGNVGQFAFNKTGDWLGLTIDAQDKAGNGIFLRNMTTGMMGPLENGKANYRSLSWTKEGDAFAALKGIESKEYSDKLYSVVAFDMLGMPTPRKTVFDPSKHKNFPKGMTVSPNRTPTWSKDRNRLLFGIHKPKKKDKSDTTKTKSKTPKTKKSGKRGKKSSTSSSSSTEEKAGLVIWHWKDKRLQSRQQVQEGQDKNFNYLCVYNVKDNRFIRLADNNIRSVSATEGERWAIGIDRTPYEEMGNLDGRRYSDIYVFDLNTGKKKLALKKSRWYFGPSPDGNKMLYYNDGHYYVYDLPSGSKLNITKDVPTSFINEENDHNVVKPPIRSLGWTKGSNSVLLSDNWDIWNVPAYGGSAVNLTVNGKKDQIRYRRTIRLDRDQKGVDLTDSVYLTVYGERNKRQGIGRIQNGIPGVEVLLCEDCAYGSLSKADDADVFAYTRQNYKDYPDYYVCNADLKDGKRMTEANPQQKNFDWSSGSIIVNYKSEKGDDLQGALYLPANYEKGKKYPTIVYIYEKLSNRLHNYSSPRSGHFEKSFFNSQGYAVFTPDIVYTINDPGMSSVWCVLPALKAAIETGVVDAEKVALHGHSWGGYQTSFLITQTNDFAAAIAGAPLTNMISMYSSIYWNSGSPNQGIFESSQGRFTSGYWDNLEAYARNSPVYYAKNVNTPLIILHNDKDGAVDWNQGIEYFNTLRRLRKPVIMLQYTGENHGLRKTPNLKDYNLRMLEFFDHYLKGKPAPKWLKDGIPHLEHDKHLKERGKKLTIKPEKKDATKEKAKKKSGKKKAA